MSAWQLSKSLRQVKMMLKRLWALAAAVVVPFLIFVVVIGLNESEIKRDTDKNSATKFDVEQKKQLKKPQPKKKEQQKRKSQSQKLPSIKPANVGANLSGSGLSFGVPQFDETEFADFQDTDLLAGTTDEAMDKSSVDTPPRVKKRSPIVYPELARKQGVSGYVTMNVLIDESGNVENVEILDSKPEEIFDLKADSTIRRWKFEPATYNGKKVKVWAMQKIVFKLD
jgi:protein TonB